MPIVDTHSSEEPISTSVARLGVYVHPYFRRGCDEEVWRNLGNWPWQVRKSIRLKIVAHDRMMVAQTIFFVDFLIPFGRLVS